MRWARHSRRPVTPASLLLMLTLVLIACHQRAPHVGAEEIIARADSLTSSDADDGRNPLVMTVTNQEFDDVCAVQRPPVRLTETRDESGIVSATIEAGDGPIARIDFGAMSNASVSVDGGPTDQTEAFTFVPAGNQSSVQFTVAAQTPDLAASVPLTVVDGCGAWETQAGEDGLS
jgi:hypothetical protein